MVRTWNISRTVEGNLDEGDFVPTEMANLQITLTAGSPLFIVGPNGSGKSSLIHDARKQLGGKRVSATRQVWLERGRIDVPAAAVVDYLRNLNQSERNPSARWLEHNPAHKWSAMLYGLVESDNERGIRIAERAYARDYEGIAAITEKESMIFTQVNDLLVASGIPIAVEHNRGQVFAVHKDSPARYDIAQMSDGERSALLIAGEVLTAGSGEVLLIDEPERHLNRGITVQFLSALFAKRPDCIFVVSTHEIELPLAHPDAQTIVVRSCNWTNSSMSSTPSSWEITHLKTEDGLDESTKREILGARKQILFVEGKADSPLYTSLLPNRPITVRKADGRKGVISAVEGLRRSEGIHHVKAFGLIDGDGRNDVSQPGIFALPCYSVESLYYCDETISAVAHDQARLHDGLDAEQMVVAAKEAAFKVMAQEHSAETLVWQICEREVREGILGQIPTVDDLKHNHKTNPVGITVDSNYATERQRYDQLVSERNLEKLVTRYPVKKSSVPSEIAKNLQFKSKELYESRVVNLVRNDPSLADALRGRIKPLVDAIEQ